MSRSSPIAEEAVLNLIRIVWCCIHFRPPLRFWVPACFSIRSDSRIFCFSWVILWFDADFHLSRLSFSFMMEFFFYSLTFLRRYPRDMISVRFCRGSADWADVEEVWSSSQEYTIPIIPVNSWIPDSDVSATKIHILRTNSLFVETFSEEWCIHSKSHFSWSHPSRKSSKPRHLQPERDWRCPRLLVPTRRHSRRAHSSRGIDGHSANNPRVMPPDSPPAQTERMVSRSSRPSQPPNSARIYRTHYSRPPPHEFHWIRTRGDSRDTQNARPQCFQPSKAWRHACGQICSIRIVLDTIAGAMATQLTDAAPRASNSNGCRRHWLFSSDAWMLCMMSTRTIGYWTWMRLLRSCTQSHLNEIHGHMNPWIHQWWWSENTRNSANGQRIKGHEIISCRFSNRVLWEQSNRMAWDVTMYGLRQILPVNVQVIVEICFKFRGIPEWSKSLLRNRFPHRTWRSSSFWP
jgi:hypothetical protein